MFASIVARFTRRASFTATCPTHSDHSDHTEEGERGRCERQGLGQILRPILRIVLTSVPLERRPRRRDFARPEIIQSASTMRADPAGAMSR
eukprot:854220-Prymnesium_polylepis.1